MYRPIPVLCCILALALAPAALWAAKVKVWNQSTPAHYDKAQLKQAVISSEGALRLSRQLKPLVELNATHVWDIVEDKAGNLFVATGDEGKVFKITPEGKVSVAFDSQESQVFCLALSPDGSIYAGTGPSGLVVRIAPDGKSKVVYHSPENYVWSLALDAKGDTIYAGTGPKGRIYQVTPGGKASVFYTTKQDHVLCLATGPDGSVYAGTDKNGLVYRIDEKGKGFVLYQAPQAEVRSLLVTADGVYAGTSSPTKRKGATGSSGGDRTSTTGTPATLTSTTKAAAKTADDDKSKDSTAPPPPAKDKDKDKEPEKSSPASSIAPPSSGENSLYRIGTDGTVREVFREKTLMLSLMKQEGKLFVGTGMDGQLFEINEASKERSEIARLDHGQIHCLCKCKNGSIVVGTSDPGKLYVLQDRYASKGTIVSEVFDARIVSKWGSLRWKAETPVGTKVTVAVRSGNIAEPDDTWSEWSDEQTDAEQATITAPAARFVQYRVTMASDNAMVTPVVRGVALRYMTTNQAPEVSSIEVPDLDAVNLDNPKKLKFKWSATDANEDDLTYNLLVRKDGWKNWVMLEEGLTKTEYEWDTTTTPAGQYQLKVVASDRKDNPAEDALEGERISAPFPVAHAAPTVTVKVVGVEGDQAIVEATATDPLVRLTGASFAVNGKKWINVFPADGLFDSKTETFKFKTEALKSGTHVLVLKVRDAAGNTGSGDVVFTVQPKR
ncbi:MAG: WD40 repeat domain-containing protein [Gemmataceae bacterium]|nr:WD40 repeat domain-containing protein [Gemmataceae bacterium]